MLRHFKKSEPQPVFLSIEEEAIVADEINQHLADVTDAENHSERLGDIIVTMGDVETVVSNTPEIGTIEESLISAVADMAVAGSDADPETVASDLLPPAEGLSAEGIADTVKNTLRRIWQAVKDAMAKMWGHVKAFFARVKEFISGTKRRIDALRELHEKYKSQLKDRQIGPNDKYIGPVDVLMINDKPTIQIGPDYEDLVRWTESLVMAMVVNGEDVMSGGTKIMQGFVDSPDAVERNMVSYMGEINRPMKTLALVARKAGDEGRNVLGGLNFIVSLPEQHTGNIFAESEDVVTVLRNYEASLRLRINERKGDYVKVDIPLTNKSEDINKVLIAANKYTRAVEAESATIVKLADRSNEVSRDLETLVNKLAETEGVDQKRARVMKELIAINGTLNKMIASNLQKIFVHNNRVSNGVLDYCIQSYKLVAGKSAEAPNA